MVPRGVLKPGAENRVAFDIEGRGTFGYAVTLTGITREFVDERDRLARPLATIRRRVYLAVPPELDGRPLATGFNTVINARPFENRATQVPRGGRVRVEIEAGRDATATGPILGEPTGAARVPARGDERGRRARWRRTASHYTELRRGPDVLLRRRAGRQASARYELRGDLPGRYRVLPTSIRGADDPGRGDFGKRRPSCPSSPPAPRPPTSTGRRPTSCTTAASATSTPAGSPRPPRRWRPSSREYTLRDDILKETARMLLFVHLARHDARRIVRDFEIVREKSPELYLAFDTLLAIGRAYAEIGEYRARLPGLDRASRGQLPGGRRGSASSSGSAAASWKASRSCCGSGASRPAARWSTPTSSAWRN